MRETDAYPTLVDILRAQATQPDSLRPAFTFLEDGEDVESKLSFSELDRRSRRLATTLVRLVPKGGRVLLIYPPGLEFIVAFYACLQASVVAVPVYPPTRSRFAAKIRRLARIADDCKASLALTTSAYLGELGSLEAVAPELAVLPFMASDAANLEETAELEDAPEPSAVAFLQYTSGSTSDPKGVTVLHCNLVANARIICAQLQLNRDSRVFSWLPFYHDMGLIGKLVTPLSTGASTVLMSPAHFVAKPVRWLRGMTRHRSQVCAAPNSAYELCCKAIDDIELEGLDLDAWRVALNGSEPVREETMRAFGQRFAQVGFRTQTFRPAYGLAESTLLISSKHVEAQPLRFGRDALLDGKATPSQLADAQAVVCCGPIDEASGTLEIARVDGTEVLEDGQVGEICVQGPSVAAGYWGNAEATKTTFEAELRGRSGHYLRTGDLGFKLAGGLYVTGRAKDLIILRGRNHYPQDLEATVGGSHPGFSPAGGIAFSIERDGSERLVVVYSIDRRRRDEPVALIAAAREALVTSHEVAAHDILLVDPSQIPKTSSGKVRRSTCKQAYLDGQLKVLHSSRGTSAEPWQLLRLEWQDVVAAPPALPFGRGNWVFIGPPDPLVGALTELIAKRGDVFASLLLPAEGGADYLRQELARLRGPVRGVVVTHGLQGDYAQAARCALAARQECPATDLRIWQLSRGLYADEPEEQLTRPGLASTPGVAEIHLPQQGLSKEAARVYHELWSPKPEPKVVLRGSRRLVPRLHREPMPRSATGWRPTPDTCVVCLISDENETLAEVARRAGRANEGVRLVVVTSSVLAAVGPERFATGLRQEGMHTLGIIAVDGAGLDGLLAQLLQSCAARWLACVDSPSSGSPASGWLARFPSPPTTASLQVTIGSDCWQSPERLREVLGTIEALAGERREGAFALASATVLSQLDADSVRSLQDPPTPTSVSTASAQSLPSVVVEAVPKPAPPRPISALEREDDPKRDHLLSLEGQSRLRALSGYVTLLTSRALGGSTSDVSPSMPLTDVGLDSVQMAELRTVLERRLRVRIPMSALIQGPTVEQLAGLLDGLLRGSQEPRS